MGYRPNFFSPSNYFRLDLALNEIDSRRGIFKFGLFEMIKIAAQEIEVVTQNELNVFSPKVAKVLSKGRNLLTVDN